MTKEIALHCMKSYSELHSDLCELCPIYGQTGSDHCFEDALQYVIGMLEQEPTTKNNLTVDAISRADAIGSIAVECSAEKLDIDYAKFLMLRRAIKALPTVTPLRPKSEWEQDHAILKAYSDGVNEVLDKIRAEIEAKCCITVGRENDGAITLHDVFEILDKYKAEKEQTE